MEKDLQARHDFLADAIEATGAGTWRWNVLTGETVFNEHWAGILGYMLAELAPVSVKTWLDLAHPLDMKNTEELLHKHFLGALDLYDCEYRMRHKNGSWVWVYDRGRVVEWREGKPLVMTGIQTDITPRKLAEKEMNKMRLRLIETEKLASLGEMAIGVAHEINQPLDAIALVLATFRKMTAKKILTEEALANGMKDIDAAIKRMTRAIYHVRTYARQQSLDFELIDLPGNIEAALNFKGEQWTAHKVELVKVVEPGLPMIQGNPYQLEQVWSNLVANAFDAMDEKEKLLRNGKLVFPSYGKKLEITVSLPAGGDMVLVTFSDNGIGMNEEQRMNALEPFVTTKVDGKGTGLGLAISNGIIERHNGKCEIESREGYGTDFKIYFPLAPSPGVEG